MLDSFRDIVHSARTLIRSRAFTAVCVISLGLGMGVVIAILLFLRMVLGTPAGIDDDRLVELVIRPNGQLRAQAGAAIIDTWSYPDYLDVRDVARGMVVTGWSRGEGLVKLPNEERMASVATMYVSSNYFSTVGVTLARGRGFTDAGDASLAEPEAIIGHRVWQIRFGSDPDVIGRPVTINGTEYTIVGVAPEGFRGHLNGLNEPYHQLWLPLSRHPRLAENESVRFARDAGWVRVVARLSEGTTLAQADAVVQSTMAALAARDPAANGEKIGGVEPYFPAGARLRAQVSFARLMILGLSGVVLLVVGLNISGMMLVRSAMRERELAIRLAMGASRWRLVRFHLSEALVMALLGGGAASAALFGGPVLLAWWFDFSGPALDLFKPDAGVILQCIALCFVTSLVLGWLPALRFSRPSIVDALKNDSTGSGRRVGRLQRLTAAAQTGIAVPFLVICGVQFDQARVTALADVGFQPKGLYAARLNLAAITNSEETRRRFVDAVQANLAQAPGAVSVSAADGLPLDFIYRNARIAPDRSNRSAAPQAESNVERESGFVTAHTTRITPGYLETIGTPLLTGRSIDANDREGAERVVVLSEPLAQQLFPAGDPLGKRVLLALASQEPQTYTVVGVTADLVSTQMGNPRPQLFLSLAQHPVSNVLLIARGAPSDPSMRGAFENAIGDGLRVTSSQARREDVFRELITGESLIQNSRSDLLTSSGVGGAAAAVA
ncbi:MAG TPA: ABC transporter permease, partial [Vicinamibacterales bacterium]